jgi:hypothetical protein
MALLSFHRGSPELTDVVSSVPGFTRIFVQAHLGHVRRPIALAASFISIGKYSPIQR